MREAEVKIRVSAQEKKEWLSRAKGLNKSLSALIRERMEFVPTNVPTNDNVPTSVPTDVPTIGDKEAEEMIVRAREVGERSNWARVREQLGEFGYEYDSVTRELSKGGRVIKLIY